MGFGLVIASWVPTITALGTCSQLDYAPKFPTEKGKAEHPCLRQSVRGSKGHGERVRNGVLHFSQ